MPWTNTRRVSYRELACETCLSHQILYRFSGRDMAPEVQFDSLDREIMNEVDGPSTLSPTKSGDKYLKEIRSLHGDKAAQRRAISELLFFASVGDLARCQRICNLWNIDVKDPNTSDYDKRTPLHLAASEGAYKVTEWLLGLGAEINVLDRFKRTPLEDAVRGEFMEEAMLLTKQGGKIWEDDKFKDLEQSRLSGKLTEMPSDINDMDADWEIDPRQLKILEKLGEGEFGIVHKALLYGTLVAAKILKVTSEIALGDFRAELDVLRRVHHPNASQLLGACTKQEPYIIVTELMTGGSLADAFKLQMSFGTRRAMELAIDAARGLAYMHNRRPSSIVHRDLKPGNLMISGSYYRDRETLVFDIGTVKLADFGLSKSLPLNKHAGYDLEATFKLTGETGSYRFMAPEVFRHEAYNFKVDVYSFSMIIYQLFEGMPPFAGQDPVEAAKKASLRDMRPTLNKLLRKEAPYPMLRRLVERCWDPSPDKRPHFLEVVQILDAEINKIPRKEYKKGGFKDKLFGRS